MDFIYSLLSKNMNGIIVILGLALMLALIWNSLTLKGYQNQLDAILNMNITTSKLSIKTQEMVDLTEQEHAKPDTIRMFQKDFNKACSLHEMFSQLIPLFPLFGILGTVSGLILQLVSNDINEVFSSLNVALGSTFWGIVFAIILKIIDSVFPARRINDTQIELENYDKKLSTAVMLGNITE